MPTQGLWYCGAKIIFLNEKGLTIRKFIKEIR